MERIEIGRDEIIFYQFVEGEYKNIKEHFSTRYLSVNKEMLESGKALPQLYKIKEECCGCTACYAACPCSGNKLGQEMVKAISYRMLDEGRLIFIKHTGGCKLNCVSKE